MINQLKVLSLCLLIPYTTSAQTSEEKQSIVKIPIELLSGEGLEKLTLEDTTRTVYQSKVYDGTDLVVYMVAIGTGITNEFDNFPLEEFIFWMNGKAVVEPAGEPAFEVHTGDYFVQAKGFRGKWNFVDIDGVHLELALVAKDRPDSTFRSPITRAMVIDRDIISGVAVPENGQIYQGPELVVNLITDVEELSKVGHERMLHVLNGVVSLTVPGDPLVYQFFPGDFFVLPKGVVGTWRAAGVQNLRMIEVHKTKS
ncbi:MAG: cupin domain-containing protein [Bacteroidota bacterium]